MSVNDKQIINHLKTLTSVLPDSDWKIKNRELLYNQISSTQNSDKAVGFNFRYFLNNNIVFQYLQTIPQSSMVAVFIFVFLVSGSFVSLHASKDSVPGDSFYIAKIMGEKTQLALTFDEKNKALLGIEFASNRAKEINQVLSQSESSSIINEKKVEELVDNFKKEITVAKSRLEKINQSKSVDSKNLPNVNTDTENTSDDSQIFSANTGKDNNGIELNDPTKNISQETVTEKTIPSVVATATKEIIKVTDPQEILKKAGESLNSDDIDSTLSLMEEAGDVIDKVGVVGDKEKTDGASSTEIEVK